MTKKLYFKYAFLFYLMLLCLNLHATGYEGNIKAYLFDCDKPLIIRSELISEEGAENTFTFLLNDEELTPYSSFYLTIIINGLIKKESSDTQDHDLLSVTIQINDKLNPEVMLIDRNLTVIPKSPNIFKLNSDGIGRLTLILNIDKSD